MNNAISSNITRFVILLLSQVIIFNNINFMGYINPCVYILFIILFPVKNNRPLFLTLAFLLGLSIDLFLDSGGMHACASVCIAFLRPIALKFCFGTLYDHQNIKFNDVEFIPNLTYVTLLTFAHHLILFLLEIFNISNLFLILQKTIFTGIFTVLLCMLITSIFSRRKK